MRTGIISASMMFATAACSTPSRDHAEANRTQTEHAGTPAPQAAGNAPASKTPASAEPAPVPAPSAPQGEIAELYVTASGTTMKFEPMALGLRVGQTAHLVFEN